MRKLMTLFACLLLVLSTAFAEIVEIRHFEELLGYLKPNTLVIYDIDNTLIEMNQLMGSDQWFYHRMKDKIAAGMGERDALEEALNEWEAVQHLSGCAPVEKNSPALVCLTQKSFPVIGLTTRGLSLTTRTLQLLESAGYDLSANTISTKETHFMVEGEGVLFRKGVLFTAGTHKGLALKGLLEALSYCPERILFVNDKKSHLLPVEEYCDHAGIPFTGLRYGFLDEKVANYDKKIAEVQWQRFGKILSDEQAAKELER